MEERRGYVEHIVFRNHENGYSVFQLITDEEELTCVGTFPVLGEGELVQVAGCMKEHPLYGKQLHAERCEILAPVISNCSTISPAVKGPLRSRVRISRRVGSDRALKVSANPMRVSPSWKYFDI